MTGRSGRWFVSSPRSHYVDILKRFETDLRRLNRSANQFSYSVADVNTFIDSFVEFNMICYEAPQKMYAPFGKEGIKAKMLGHLRNQARRN